MRKAWILAIRCGMLLVFWSKLVFAGETLLSVSFAKDKWDPAAWVIAHNPTVPHPGKWVQRDTCIENETPVDPAKKSSLDETLTTMVYNKKLAGDYTIAATFEIGAGAAPGIVLAQDWAPDDKGQPTYGEFYEVVIYEMGINLWHHFARDGKRLYEKSAYETFPLKADTRYQLTVKKKGKSLAFFIDGHEMGVIVPALADELFVGVEGCEGVCRIMDFTVTR